MSKDMVFDDNIRPRRLDDFIGQDELRANLRVFLAAAREETGLPLLSDVHAVDQVARAAAVLSRLRRALQRGDCSSVCGIMAPAFLRLNAARSSNPFTASTTA